VYPYERGKPPRANEREMDRKHLISLLQRSAAWDQEQTRFCPDDKEIAGFVDDTMLAADRVMIERHLSECPACVHRVGLVTRLLRENGANTETVPAKAMTSLTGMVSRWAVAATVLLAVGWLAWAPTDGPIDFRQTRTVESRLTPPEILAPNSGILADQERLVVRWTEVPASLYYEVRVVSDAGDLLSQQRVDAAEWRPEKDLGLQPGREYFIRVDAYLSDSQSISSKHIPIRLRE